MINDEVHVGARNQRGELVEQLLRSEGDVIGAVAPRRSGEGALPEVESRFALRGDSVAQSCKSLSCVRSSLPYLAVPTAE